MDSDILIEIENRIRQYGQKKDLSSLKTYVNNLRTDQLTDLVKSKINNVNFGQCWNYILQAFTDSSESHEKRLEVLSTLLQEIDKNDVPTSQYNSFIKDLSTELSKFKTGDLVKLCELCLEFIQHTQVLQISWKDLLPDLLDILMERELVFHNDVDMSGLEYKKQFISSLCLIQWSPNTVTSLASMFCNMPLTKEEHLQVVNKLGQYIEKLTPQEIPVFVYQLIKLCKRHTSGSIFLRLQNYFGVRIYEVARNSSETNSESIDMDAIESASHQELIDAESTVLYHIQSSASLEHECIAVYLSSLKNVMRSPEFVLHPFQLTVLLTISSVPHYEERVFEIIRSCVSRSFNEEVKKNNSCWIRDMIPLSCKTESVFAQIVNFSMNNRDFILQGLVNFGFHLLSVGSALGRDVIAEKQWQLGNMILFKIVKRKRNIAPTIIQTMSACIVSGKNVTQYIECMYMLSRHLALLMLENQSCIVELMECLLQMPENTSRQLLDAVIPLIKVSPTIRDHLILLLRKALYTRNSETRQMAVTGFLKLLTNLKISNLTVLSQSSCSSDSFASGHSLFTQISLNRTTQCAPSSFCNEALCLEVLSILQKCFMQQAEVRTQMYEGLYDAVCMNPELSISILDVMWMHFSGYYVMNEETLPPLNFLKITITRDVEVLKEEPLGKLIYAISLITSKASEIHSENSTVMKFKEVLNSLTLRMISCELVHFALDDGTDLLDTVPESQQKFIILKEILSVYEALIGYKLCTWGPESDTTAREINNLYQAHARFLHFSKNLSKPKKKKNDNNRTTQENNTTTDTRKDKSSKIFKVPDSLLDFQTLGKALHLLHDTEIEWTTTAQANAIRSKKEIHRHITQSTIHFVNVIKTKKPIDIQYSKMYFNYLLEIADVLYNRCIKRLSEFIDFDCTTAVLSAECFYNVLNLVCNQYKSNLKIFFQKIGMRDKEEEFVVCLTDVVETYQKLFELDEEDATEDPEFKKMGLILINTLTILCNQIPCDNNALSLQVMDWCKNFALNNTITNKQVVTNFINLTFDVSIKFKVSLTLFENMAIKLGTTIGLITEEEQTSEDFTLVTETNAQNILVCLCGSIKTILEETEWIITRLKSEYTMINYPGSENIERRREYLKSKERGICCQLCFVVTILSNVCNITVQPGNVPEAILKNLIQLFCCLTSLSKYFLMRSSKVNIVYQGARFERLVKLAGKQLAQTVYKFILYIEESQKPDAENTQVKKKNVDTSTLKNKVLKDTRLIPKVIYEMEQFSKTICQISTKTKVNLSKHVGQGTVRDFRILHIKEVLEQAGPNLADTTMAVTQASEKTTTMDDTCIEDSDKENEDSDDDQSENPPPKKKSKC